MKLNVLVFITLFCFIAAPLFADEVRPGLRIPEKVQIESDEILLGSLGKIYGEEEEFGELIEKLKNISLGQAPRPLSSKIISGESILDAIQGQGLPLDAFGYSIPREVEIFREGRVLTREEVLAAAKLQLHTDPDLNIQVKGIEWDTDLVLPVGVPSIKVESLGASDKGKMPLRVEVVQADQVMGRFLATALVDDWRTIPVVRGRLDKGSIIRSDDIRLLRSNLANLPDDVALNIDEISGRRVTRAISPGSTVRLSDVDIPPVIERGKIVKMIYTSGGLTAVATGVAAEPGFTNSVIQLRNERSNKIVRGKVVNSEEVQVIN
ncbi:MAG TPA: flagellar basal body P-ring formation chaperone FlgA [Oligoflexia bacterium]|mgnify:CR=1 FL=1|nr:flagellar basal body P-ring formation chaperone FlgA [Oligoflexia bacterium]HMP49786.1 flagellar basal body P-ring formation chaperone FlgA [Oligoflexia bacterium]